MRDLDIHIVRLFIHVLAATIWVGGQFVLAALVTPMRKVSDDAPRAAANAFNRLAWPAFAVLVATGVWNLVEVNLADRTIEYQVVLLVKLVAVAVAGAGAMIHSVGRSKAALAVGGAATALGSVAALFIGVWLHG